MSEAERLVEEVAMEVCAANRRGFACVCKRDGRSPITCEGEACQDAVASARAALAIGLEAAAKVAEHGVTWTPSLSEANTRVSRETSYLLGKAIRALLP